MTPSFSETFEFVKLAKIGTHLKPDKYIRRSAFKLNFEMKDVSLTKWRDEGLIFADVFGSFDIVKNVYLSLSLVSSKCVSSHFELIRIDLMMRNIDNVLR